MPPLTKLQKTDTIRKLLQQNYAFISRSDLCTILGMEEKSLTLWELETGENYPLNAYYLANGPFKTVIYDLVSVLEYVAGPAAAHRILTEEGKASA